MWWGRWRGLVREGRREQDLGLGELAPKEESVHAAPAGNGNTAIYRLVEGIRRGVHLPLSASYLWTA